MSDKELNTIENDKQLKDWRGWVVTPSTIEGLISHDINAINKFYLDNYNHLYAMAYNYVYKMRNIFNRYAYELDDVIQGLYVDMPYLVYDKGAAYFVRCVYNDSFSRAPFGGRSACNTRLYENNIKVDTISIFKTIAEGLSLGDLLIGDTVDYYELESVNEYKILEFIKPYLTPREYSALELFVDGYSYTHIANTVGGKGELSVLINGIRYKLYQHWDDLINFLISLDLNLESYRIIKPAIYSEVIEREQKKRKRRNEAEKARREKRKAQQQAVYS